jgi:diadenosine tetraphosphate (Ap4A) HIT family hydrolase
MSEPPSQWMPREQWEALVRGEGCPLCVEHKSVERVNAEGYVVADLRLSRLRLAMNQYVPGYCVLICAKHVREPYHLTLEERAFFFEDLMRAAQALEHVFSPAKMNFQILGNAVPHLHVHLVPRYYGDAAPSRPIDPGAQTLTLEPHVYEERVGLIRAALTSL